MVKYIPEQGDIVILTFDPQTRHEQKGRRPAIIVSNKTFNQYQDLNLRVLLQIKKGVFYFILDMMVKM